MSKKNPIALLLNDIHVSKDNIPEFNKNWNEAIEICQRNGVKDMIIGGDLWQSSSAQILNVLMAVRQAIIKATAAGITLTIAEGNHDKVDKDSVLGYSHIFSEYPNVYVIDEYSVIDLNDDTVLYIMCYFPENGSFADRLTRIVSEDFDESKRNILYIHQGIRGGLATISDDELPASLFNAFDATLVGHYHDRKKIKNTNIEYIGASRQHNFGEDEEKGYTILFDDGSYEFVKNEVNVRYKTVELDAADIINGTAIQQDGYKVRAKVRCSSSESNAIKQKLIELGYTKVEAITEEVVATQGTDRSLEHKYDKNGIKTEYTSFCADKGISNVEMGLRYLDKIN